MKPKTADWIEQILSQENPLKSEDKKILMEALEAAARTFSGRSMEKAHEAKSTRH